MQAWTSPDACAEPGVQRLGAWVLTPDDRLLRRPAWSLVHDEGARIELTSAEHAAVACLFAAPTHGADAAVLTQAVLLAWQAPRNRCPRRGVNLSVLLGRLRAKARRAGVELPLQCVATRYSWGR